MTEQTAPLVSVIMNCLNGERFLGDALASVAAQELRDWEVVFWDNASTDASAKIAQSFGPQVRYLRASHTEPLGAARNYAVRQARGKYLAFLDTDDLWIRDTLSTLVAAIEKDSAAVAYAGVVEIDVNGLEMRTVLPQRTSGEVFEALLRQFDIPVPAVLVRREALLAAGLEFDPAIRASEEYCLFMQLAATGCRFVTVPRALARYRVHSGTLTSQAIGRWAAEREYTLDRIAAAHPDLLRQYARGFREARARAAYYRARWSIAQGDRASAVRALWPAALVHPRYAALLVVAAIAPRLWRWMMRWRYGREDHQ